MGWFTDVLGYIPGIGQAVDLVGGIFGFDDTSRSIRSNEKIANMNMKSVDATNKQNWINQKETNESNQKIAQMYNANQVQLQNDMNNFNKQMWDLNNAYNSPSRQLARAASAGINPNVVFGQPVAASPVQQTSIPSQQMSEMRPYRADAPQSDMRYDYKNLETIGKALHGLSRLPFVREELNSLKEEVRGKRIDNESKEYDLQGKKDADAFYGGNAYYTATDGSDRVITSDEFDRLSDTEKQAFLNRDFPYVTINGEKKPNYNASQLPFTNKATFEAYKEVQALPNFIQNVRADRLQNSLREYVAKHQISAKDANGNPSVVYALAHMPEVQYNNLLQTYRNLLQNFNWSAEDRELNKKILGLQFEQIERNSQHDFFKYIDKIGSGEMTAGDWIKMLLVGIHDMLGGASQFIRKR